MSIQIIISTINKELIQAFALLDSWFDRDDEFLLSTSGRDESVLQCLERTLALNHYLIKAVEKASMDVRINGSQDLNHALSQYVFDISLLERAIGDCVPQENSVTFDARSVKEIRAQLRNQLYRCLCILDVLENGEGVFHKIPFADVSNAFDLYHCLYLIAIRVKQRLAEFV